MFVPGVSARDRVLQLANRGASLGREGDGRARSSRLRLSNAVPLRARKKVRTFSPRIVSRFRDCPPLPHSPTCVIPHGAHRRVVHRPFDPLRQMTCGGSGRARVTLRGRRVRSSGARMPRKRQTTFQPGVRLVFDSNGLTVPTSRWSNRRASLSKHCFLETRVSLAHSRSTTPTTRLIVPSTG